jgi:predicted dehydrogenase
MVTSLSTSLPICQPVSVSEGAKSMVAFGVIGYGYWGPNIVRNLDGLEGATVLAISDKSPAARERAQKATHGIRLMADASEVITAPEIDAVAIVTPVWTHFELAKAALENGKHVFVEKPFTSNTAQAEELINIAARKTCKSWLTIPSCSLGR